MTWLPQYTSDTINCFCRVMRSQVSVADCRQILPAHPPPFHITYKSFCQWMMFNWCDNWYSLSSSLSPKCGCVAQKFGARPSLGLQGEIRLDTDTACWFIVWGNNLANEPDLARDVTGVQTAHCSTISFPAVQWSSLFNIVNLRKSPDDL